jgi:tRNA-Thr(GGU) m(6)t(6)A37 methyltransferase TsaA
VAWAMTKQSTGQNAQGLRDVRSELFPKSRIAVKNATTDLTTSELMMIVLQPIGVVKNLRPTATDDYWGGMISEIIIDEPLGADGRAGIEEFSHAEVIFYFHLVEDDQIVRGARHPRNNSRWPKVGILAQRGKNRPNRLGLSIVKIVERRGNRLYVEGLDAIDGTPILDIKPVMNEFLPHQHVLQPEWATEIMQDYWKDARSES